MVDISEHTETRTMMASLRHSTPPWSPLEMRFANSAVGTCQRRYLQMTCDALLAPEDSLAAATGRIPESARLVLVC